MINKLKTKRNLPDKTGAEDEKIFNKLIKTPSLQVLISSERVKSRKLQVKTPSEEVKNKNLTMIIQEKEDMRYFITLNI